MRWSEDFESGLPEIDSQHRQIFACIQRLHLWQKSANGSSIREQLLLLGRLARCHFDYEEWLMAAYGYPQADRHAEEHRKLISEAQGYQDNKVFRPQQLARVLGNWLISHTLLDDRPLVWHVQQVRSSGVDVQPSKSLLDAFERAVCDGALDMATESPGVMR